MKSKALAASCLATLTLLACAASSGDPTASSSAAIVPVNPSWLGWDNLAGNLASNAVTVTTRGGQLGVFATNWGQVFEQWSSTPNEWWPALGSWSNLGNNGHAFNGVAAVAVGTNVELFAVDAETGHLMHQEGTAPLLNVPTWNSGGWEDLGGNLNSAASTVLTVLVSEPGNQINVFGTVPGTNAIAYIKGTGYGAFGAWSSDTTFATSSTPSMPAVVSWGLNRLDMFIRGTDDKLYHRASSDNGATWYPAAGASPAWEALGGSVGSTPVAVSWGPNRIDLFAAQPTTGAITHLDFDGTGWSSWLPVNGGSTWVNTYGSPAPAAITTGVGSLQLFIQGADRGLYTVSMTGTDPQGNPTWSAWNGPITPCFIEGGTASVVSRDGDTLDLVVTGAPDANGNKSVFHNTTAPQFHGTTNSSPPACPLGGVNQPCANESSCNATLTCQNLTCVCPAGTKLSGSSCVAPPPPPPPPPPCVPSAPSGSYTAQNVYSPVFGGQTDIQISGTFNPGGCGVVPVVPGPITLVIAGLTHPVIVGYQPVIASSVPPTGITFTATFSQGEIGKGSWYVEIMKESVPSQQLFVMPQLLTVN